MQGTFDQPPIVVVQSRRKMVVLLLISLIFAAGSILLLRAHPPQELGWLGIAFSGLGACVFVGQLVRPGSLMLAPDGIAWRNLWRTNRIAWADTREFAPLAVSLTTRHVGFLYRNEPDGAFFPGSFGGGWEMSATRLCELLNAARAHWHRD